MAAKKRRRNQVDDMVDTAEVTPNAEAAGRAKRRYRLIRRALTLSPFMTAFCALVAFIVVGMLIQNMQAGSQAAGEVSASQTGRTQATSALQDWLDGEDSLLAGSRITSWDGVSNTEDVEATDGEIGYQLMTHDFTIATEEGTSYRAAVRTAYAPSKGVKVISSPTLTPLAPTAVSDWEPEEPAEGWREASASAAATDAIDSWATALMSSPQDLKLTTRDENASHVYATLTGVTASEVSVAEARSPESRQGEVDTSTLVATVSVQLVADDAAGEQEKTTTVTYDVLVRGADTAAPYVTAWGPAGSGTSLTDHENAAALDGTVDDAPAGQISPSDGGGEAPFGQSEPSDGGGADQQIDAEEN
ncbi:hypothetical protein BH708_02350 [Brachybacterium sp. P6-10-X1]|uniref:hypothetical protein n=1 Tax=Brachybacterium sp. P6-10-X1 TaxID=1903186 RepID=UPI0009718A72|nr:hypothetical protein [Brachybacterium sp. P6-10-X1]APX31749.1 hypothetical protein BH708_02350 [Brachybacterium sp. P6-10-X1]